MNAPAQPQWRDGRGMVSSRSAGPVLGSVPQHPQLHKLEKLITALTAARKSAAQGMFFASHNGAEAMRAMHDLTEIDAVHDLANDVQFMVRGGEE